MMRGRYFWQRRLFFYVHSRKNWVLFRVLLLVVFFCFLLVFLDARLRPVVLEMATAKARNIALKTVNDAISDTLQKNAVGYRDLLTLEKDEGGAITALRTNMVTLNTLKTEVTNQVVERISSIDPKEIAIPIGNIVKWNLLFGRGPAIAVKLIPVGTAETNFVSIFTSAGINQTKHRIVLQCRVKVSILLPGQSVSAEVMSEINVAETVLIGSVPDSYTYIDDQRESDILSKINDYRTD